MKTNLKYISGVFLALLLVLTGCSKEDYKLGDIVTPTSVKLNVEIVGTSTAKPDGDGSGKVKVTVLGDNVLTYQVDYGAIGQKPTRVVLNNGVGEFTYKATKTDVYDLTITAFAYGKGGAGSNLIKNIKLKIDSPIVEYLTNNDSKSWVVDKDIDGHFGVGPFNIGSVRLEWYAAKANEKKDFPCFYTNSFKFTKLANGTFTLEVISPSKSVFAKTGANNELSTIPGLPKGDNKEQCYDYLGGISAFTLGAATSGIPATSSNKDNSGSTQVSIILAGLNTFIGYGSVAKEYEILDITANSLYLRVQGTETGNAWYLRLKPAP
jgi:hypothetical protein